MSYLAVTKSKGHSYYKIMESYRDETGKVKHRVIFNIGTVADLYDLLPETVRNGKFKDESPPIANVHEPSIELKSVRCRIHGAPYLLYRVSDWLGVSELMRQFFPPKIANGIDRPLSLILATIQRACNPGSKAEFANWFSHTSLPEYLNIDPELCTSQHFWEQMDGITKENIKDFEITLFKKILAQFPDVKEKIESLSSDFTNYYTYISNQNYRCLIAQLGHSKEGRSGQKIFCVAVVISPLLGIPIATLVYEGNKNDKTAMKEFYSELENRLEGIVDLGKITFVFDGGGVSEDNLKLVPGHYITRGSLKSVSDLYGVPLSSYENVELDDGKIVPSYRKKATLYGKEHTVIVSLSDELKKGQVKELNKQIGKFEEAITELNKSLENPRGTMDKRKQSMEDRIKKMLLPNFYFPDFINVSYKTEEMADPILLREFKKEEKQAKKENRDPELCIEGKLIHKPEEIPLVSIVKSVSYEIDNNKKESVIDKYYGKHLLVTDQDDWDTKRILTVYRDQEFIERFFRDSKDTNHFSVRPAYHWTDSKLRVHVMTCYLGLSLCRFAQYMLKDKYSFHIPSPKLLDCCSHVQECHVILTVDGKMKAMKTLSELSGLDQEVWMKVTDLLTWFKENTASEIQAQEAEK